MNFIVLRAGQVIHDEPMFPAARPTPVGMPAVEGVGADEHLGLNHVDGWMVEISSLDELLRLVTQTQGQVTLRRPMDFTLNDRPAFVIDVTPGIGQS